MRQHEFQVLTLQPFRTSELRSLYDGCA